MPLSSTQPVRVSEHTSDIEERIAGAARVALFLDFDGTISHIVARPEDAQIAPGIREAIETLAGQPNTDVAIVSGRALADVRERTGIKNLIYVGNHGLEIEGNSIRFREPQAEALRRELRCVSLQLKLALGEAEGVEIEDKGLTLSVHYRQVPEQLHDWVRAATIDAVSRSRSFTCREGKMVLEVRPQIAWNKGYAVRWILREILPDCSLAIYIGDDVTDEDAFAGISEGITIRVGEPDDSRAQFYLPGVADVREFLQWLTQAKRHASLATAQRAGR